MSDDLVKFVIPAAFVIKRVRLMPAELVYGYRHGWLADSDVVEVSLAAFEAGGGSLPSSVEEGLALLLSDELDRIPNLIGDLDRTSAGAANPRAVWLFLALDWLHEHRADHLEPLEVIEMLYADFGYPEEIEGLIRFVPPPSGGATGERAIEDRWQEYLNRKAAEYRMRGVK